MTRMKAIDIISKTSFVTLMFVVIIYYGYGQNSLDRLENYQFEFLGGCDKHIVKRFFLNDSVFIDSTTIIFSNEKAVIVDTFMKNNNTWHYLLNGEWILYFSKDKFLKKEQVNIIGKGQAIPSTILIPVRQEMLNNRNVFIYRVQSPHDVIAFITEYYFDFDLGVVKILDTSFDPMCSIKISSLIINP